MWAIVLLMYVRFLERDSANQMITQAQTRKDCVWVFIDGSIHDDLSGVAVVFVNGHGPFVATSLRFPLGLFN